MRGRRCAPSPRPATKPATSSRSRSRGPTRRWAGDPPGRPSGRAVPSSVAASSPIRSWPRGGRRRSSTALHPRSPCRCGPMDGRSGRSRSTPPPPMRSPPRTWSCWPASPTTSPSGSRCSASARRPGRAFAGASATSLRLNGSPTSAAGSGTSPRTRPSGPRRSTGSWASSPVPSRRRPRDSSPGSTRTTGPGCGRPSWRPSGTAAGTTSSSGSFDPTAASASSTSRASSSAIHPAWRPGWWAPSRTSRSAWSSRRSS